jgi:hypothetical protein
MVIGVISSPLQRQHIDTRRKTAQAAGKKYAFWRYVAHPRGICLYFCSSVRYVTPFMAIEAERRRTSPVCALAELVTPIQTLSIRETKKAGGVSESFGEIKLRQGEEF